MTEKLLPCPFCGGTDVNLRQHLATNMSWVSCGECGLEAPSETGWTDDIAIEYWNTRAPSPSEHVILMTPEEYDRALEYANAYSTSPEEHREMMLAGLWATLISKGRAATAAPVQHVGVPQDISTAPSMTDVLVWWPIVKLDEDGDPTDEIVDGCWIISEDQGGYWIEPEVMNAIGDHMGDDHTYADKPSHWMPLPARLFTATTEGSDNG